MNAAAMKMRRINWRRQKLQYSEFALSLLRVQVTVALTTYQYYYKSYDSKERVAHYNNNMFHSKNYIIIL